MVKWCVLDILGLIKYLIRIISSYLLIFKKWLLDYLKLTYLAQIIFWLNSTVLGPSLQKYRSLRSKIMTQKEAIKQIQSVK